MSEHKVHETHCCVYHGCKYGSDTCPVVEKRSIQKYKCESCVNVEQNLKQLKSDPVVAKCLSDINCFVSNQADDWRDEEYLSSKIDQQLNELLQAIIGNYWRG